ncbi:RDD family protein [Cellulomonas sp. IC4_254]|uniref:RDD family protein n=1 Tax=Cellulomonas sp. IC4_254 TaxID=2714040 RepID=UPI00142175DD|nr:RDD family protein [Cellulomonas sp. IC4_254]NHT17515.1 FHA domain-containing protein [Cellulomonas sp. IC4_254]
MSATPAGAVTVRACASCHRPLREDARFCTACGAPAQPDATVTVVEGAQGRTRADVRPREPRPAVLHPAFGDATPAGPGRRVLAYAVDAVAVGAVAGGLLAWTGSWLLVALVVVELAVGLLVWEAHTGRTLGNTALGLRTAREETPYSVGPARGFLRGLVLAAGHAAAGLGQWLVVASGAFDRTGRAQAWHDRVGRAVVVDVRAHERAVEEAADAAERAGAVAAGAAPRAGAQVGAPGVPQQPGAVPGVGRPPAVAAPAQQPQVGPAPAAARPVPPAAAPQPPAPVATPADGAAGAPTGRRAARAAAAQSPVAPTTDPSQQQPPAAAAQPAAEAASVGIRPVVPARAAPERPAPTPVVDRAQPAPFLVTLDTGQVMSVTGPGLIGRAPRPVAGERCDHVIVVDDPERSVSRTHARFGIDNGTFWVSDAGSGNGTTLRLPGGRVVPVPADQRVLVPSGSTIQVGDRGVRIDAPGAARG